MSSDRAPCCALRCMCELTGEQAPRREVWKKCTPINLAISMRACRRPRYVAADRDSSLRTSAVGVLSSRKLLSSSARLFSNLSSSESIARSLPMVSWSRRLISLRLVRRAISETSPLTCPIAETCAIAAAPFGGLNASPCLRAVQVCREGSEAATKGQDKSWKRGIKTCPLQLQQHARYNSNNSPVPASSMGGPFYATLALATSMGGHLGPVKGPAHPTVPS